MSGFPPLFLLNKLPLHGHATFQGHVMLACFSLLVIINNDAMDICIHISDWTYVFILPRNEVSGYMVTLCLIF